MNPISASQAGDRYAEALEIAIAAKAGSLSSRLLKADLTLDAKLA